MYYLSSHKGDGSILKRRHGKHRQSLGDMVSALKSRRDARNARECKSTRPCGNRRGLPTRVTRKRRKAPASRLPLDKLAHQRRKLLTIIDSHQRPCQFDPISPASRTSSPETVMRHSRGGAVLGKICQQASRDLESVDAIGTGERRGGISVRCGSLPGAEAE